MSASAHKRTGTGSRRRVKYTEQPFPKAEPEANRHVHEQLQSPLFKVPKELRNKFFDSAFHESSDKIDIGALFCLEESDTLNRDHDAVTPPSTSLILTW
jgi:hypothetical protein